MGRTASKELMELGRRVADWRRQGGGKGSRIPEELWDAAVKVSRVDGLWATSKALHFEYTRLKARSQATVRVGELAEAKRAEHIAVGGAGDVPEPGIPARVAERERFVTVGMGLSPLAAQTVIELVGRHGERMRVEMSGGVDLVGLVQTFWSREP